MSSCYTCTQESLSQRAPREEVWSIAGWRVALAFGTSLPGWCVVVPTRHVEALDELSPGDVAGLGPLLRDLSAALRALTGCAKTYVMLLAEAEGFSHLHFHVVPRAADVDEAHRGVGVFSHFREEPQSDEAMDAVALALRDVMSSVVRDSQS